MGIFDFLFNRKNKQTQAQPDLQPAPTKKTPDQPIDPALLEKVEVVPGLFIPRAYANHWHELQQGPCPAVAITATPTDELTLEQSKFGFYPYMPIGFDYPTDAAGEFMFPLAQINFSEMPPLPGYPTSGYLQFYISAFHESYGADWDDLQNQENFRVLFFEEQDIRQHKADFSFLDKVMQATDLPVTKPHAMQFRRTEEYVSIGDAYYNQLAPKDFYAIAAMYPAEEDALIDLAYDVFNNTGHKVGGYAEFTQEDPRTDNPAFDQYVQLMQIDSDEEIMWGDAGIAHFYIDPVDLEKKDFSKVMYYWDCS